MTLSYLIYTKGTERDASFKFLNYILLQMFHFINNSGNGQGVTTTNVYHSRLSIIDKYIKEPVQFAKSFGVLMLNEGFTRQGTVFSSTCAESP